MHPLIEALQRRLDEVEDFIDRIEVDEDKPNSYDEAIRDLTEGFEFHFQGIEEDNEIINDKLSRLNEGALYKCIALDSRIKMVIQKSKNKLNEIGCEPEVNREMNDDNEELATKGSIENWIHRECSSHVDSVLKSQIQLKIGKLYDCGFSVDSETNQYSGKMSFIPLSFDLDNSQLFVLIWAKELYEKYPDAIKNSIKMSYNEIWNSGLKDKYPDIEEFAFVCTLQENGSLQCEDNL